MSTLLCIHINNAAANPKIEALVNDISKLTLLEVADLTALLKVRHVHAWDAT